PELIAGVDGIVAIVGEGEAERRTPFEQLVQEARRAGRRMVAVVEGSSRWREPLDAWDVPYLTHRRSPAGELSLVLLLEAGALRRGRGSSPLAQALAGRHDRERRHVSLWAVVPAFNEEERIEATVAALYKGVRCDRVVVVDDGSHDATGERARRAGAAVVALSRNGGKGRALRRGVEEVLRGGAGVDVLLPADADRGPAAARLVPLVQAVREQGKDLAIASFS